MATILDQILGLVGKGANFMAPVTTKRYKDAWKLFSDKSLSDEEKKKLYQDVMSTGGKSGLELGSYLIPFGKGASAVTKTVLPALGVYGAQQVSQDKPLTLGGAGASVATAGLLGKILGGGQGVQKTGQKMRQSVSNLQAKASPWYSNEIKGLQEAQKTLGLTGSAEQQLSKLPSRMEQIGEKIKSLVTGKKVNVKNVNSSINKWLNNIDYLGDEKTFEKAVLQLEQRVAKAGVSADKLYALKSELAGEMGPIFTKLRKGSDLLPKQAAKFAYWNGLKDVIDTVSPDVRAVNSLQNKAYILAEGLTENVGKGGLKIPLLGQQGGETTQKIKDLLGRGFEKAGAPISSMLGPLNTGAGQNVRTQALFRALGMEMPQTQPTDKTPVLQGQEQPQQIGAQQEEILSPEGQWRWDPQANDWVPNQAAKQGGGLNKDKLAQILPMLMMQDLEQTGGKNIPELKTIFDVLEVAGGGKTSATVQKRQTILEQASPVLARIASSALKAPTGMEGAGLALLGKIPGVEGGEAEYLSRDADAFARLIASAFASEVGVATDKDVARWKGMMPQPGDTMTERRRQVTKMVEQIQNEAKTLNMDVPPTIIEIINMLAQ